MWKLAFVIPAVIFLAGCKDTVIVEDNGPNQRKREQAMERCVGVILSSDVKDAEESLRIACTQAVYGEYN
jgi:hypothetical protein